MSKRLTKKQQVEILHRLKLGESITYLAKEYGVTKQAIDAYKRKIPDYYEQQQDNWNQMADEFQKSIIAAHRVASKMIEEAATGERDIPLNQLSTYIGTIYDKQALLRGESTQNSNITIQLEGELDEYAN